jgi:hypothetical protein
VTKNKYQQVLILSPSQFKLSIPRLYRSQKTPSPEISSERTVPVKAVYEQEARELCEQMTAVLHHPSLPATAMFSHS